MDKYNLPSFLILLFIFYNYNFEFDILIGMDFPTIFRTQHHAILFPVRDRVVFLESLRDFLVGEKIIHEITEGNVIDIDTARLLKSWSIKSYGAPKIMILSFHTITIPAQNALLKVLEEPTEGSRFILITSHIDALLPTVRSRLSVQKVKEEYTIDPVVKMFLKTAHVDRMKLEEIENLLDAKDGDDRKDREKLQAFISNLFEVLVKDLPAGRAGKVDNTITKEVAKCVSYASDPSSSGKSLLEYLSLRVPRIGL